MPPRGNPVLLPFWHRLGNGETITPAGSTANAIVPDGTEIAHIAAEGGDIFYQFGGIASALSPGYVPENGRVIEGPLRDFTALSIFGAAGAIAHIIYYQQNRGQ